MSKKLNLLGLLTWWNIIHLASYFGKNDVTQNAELFQPKFGSNIGKPSNWVNIFNNRFGFVHILPQIGLKQLSIL